MTLCMSDRRKRRVYWLMNQCPLRIGSCSRPIVIRTRFDTASLPSASCTLSSRGWDTCKQDEFKLPIRCWSRGRVLHLTCAMEHCQEKVVLLVVGVEDGQKVCQASQSSGSTLFILALSMSAYASAVVKSGGCQYATETITHSVASKCATIWFRTSRRVLEPDRNKSCLAAFTG